MTDTPMAATPLNLDRIAAETAHRITDTVTAGRAKAAGDLEQVATDALEVFQSRGVYTGLLYLWAQKLRPVAVGAIRNALLNLLREQPALVAVPGSVPGNTAGWLQVSAFLTSAGSPLHDLDRLLLIMTVYERTLIYVRYGARAVAVNAGSVDSENSGDEPSQPEDQAP